jgi:anti-sigma factor RsiW
MSCSPFDLKDYLFQELPLPQQRLVEVHVKTCDACRSEVERLRLTEAALLTLREEEIPQRIAFVSDKIFEPSPARRWLGAFWGSTARLGFASAAMLSIALIVFALNRPATIVRETVPTTISAVSSSADIEQRIQAAVDRAVAESEARQAKKTAQLVADVERRDREERRQLIRFTDAQMEVMQKRTNAARMAAYHGGLNQ